MPIRRRLTVAFVAVMALVLLASGGFLHQRMKSNLNRALDAALRSRATDLAALAQQSDTGLADAQQPRGAAALGPAQLIDRSGQVIDRSPDAPRTPLFPTSALRSAAIGRSSFLDRRAPGKPPSRLLAQTVQAQGQRMVVIVGGSLEPLDTALGSLDSQLLVGGPVILLVAAIAAYVLAGGALRPVEAMRRRAAAFSANDLEQRLPEPAADDELRRLAHTLNAMLERVERAVRKERTFIANVSHELRSPLATLQAELELIARDRPHGSALANQIASVIEETGRLTEIISALLLLAHSDSHELVLRRRPVDVDALLADAITRTDHADPPVTIMSAPGLIIDADRELLTQALSNLIANARRHAHTGVTVTARADNDQLELRVADDGDGFPEDFLPRAFDRFSRADNGRTGDGAGLGLSIVQAIAQLHRGSVHATNRHAGGADVRICLPTNPAEPKHPSPGSALEPPGRTPHSGAARK